MIINDLTNESLVKRLDMVFDQSSFKGIILKNEEISEYLEFNKKYLNKIDEFINEIFNDGYLYVCQPLKSVVKDDSDEDINPVTAEIIPTQINNFEFNRVNIVNYGLGNPTKINDLFDLELITNKGDIFQYEISGSELIRLKFQGCLFINKNGDILAKNVYKALEAFNKYYN